MNEQPPMFSRPEPQQPPPSFYGPGHPGGSEPAPAPEKKPKEKRRGGIGVVLASVLLGGAAGFGGAAAYDQLDDDPAPVPSSAEESAPVIDQGTSTGGEGSVEAVADAVLPSVVRIDVRSVNGEGSGSGIVMTEDGQILTNAHVVEAGEGSTLRVSFSDGTRTSATVLGTDPLTDTAVIQAEDVSGLTPATIGKSENLAVGQQVVAIGSPFGLDATVTSGIVSALDRPVNVSSDERGNSTTYPAIQTDAAINPGNSGGPLVDMTGSVVGINSSIRTTGPTSGGAAGSIGLGFSIPIDEILPIVEQMAAGETPTHARLGITVSDSGQADADAVGALVRTVGAGSTADDAGLTAGDVVTRIDDSMIDSADDLVATVRTYRPGDEVTLTYLRDGDEQTVTLVLDSDAEEE